MDKITADNFFCLQREHWFSKMQLFDASRVLMGGITQSIYFRWDKYPEEVIHFYLRRKINIMGILALLIIQLLLQVDKAIN